MLKLIFTPWLKALKQSFLEQKSAYPSNKRARERLSNCLVSLNGALALRLDVCLIVGYGMSV